MCDALKFFCDWDWETVLAALIGALFLVIGYLIQGYFDRREKRRENYKEAYFEFLQGDAESQVRGVMDELYENSLPSDEGQRKIKISDDKIKEKMATLSSRNKLLLYGSDKVIQAYLSFVEHIDEQTKAKNENRQIEDRMEILWNEILVAMREDIYGENSIDRQKINKYFNTFNRF